MKTTHKDIPRPTRTGAIAHRFRIALDIGAFSIGGAVLDEGNRLTSAFVRNYAHGDRLHDWLKNVLKLQVGDFVRVPAGRGGRVIVGMRRGGGKPENTEVDVPAWIAEALETTSGFPVDVSIRSDGSVWRAVLRSRIEDIFGLLKYDGPRVSDEQIREAVQQAAVERYLRSC